MNVLYRLKNTIVSDWISELFTGQLNFQNPKPNISEAYRVRCFYHLKLIFNILQFKSKWNTSELYMDDLP